MDILDQRIDEARARFRIAQAKRNANPAVTADVGSTLAVRRLDETWAALKEKHGEMVEAPPVATPSSPGSQMKLADQWAEEFRLAEAAEAARQAHGGGPFEASTHKLPPHVVYG